MDRRTTIRPHCILSRPPIASSMQTKNPSRKECDSRKTRAWVCQPLDPCHTNLKSAHAIRCQQTSTMQETKTSHALTSDFSLLLDDTFCGCNVRATNPRSCRTKEGGNRCHICPRARTFLGEPLLAWKVNTEVPHSQGQRAQLNKMENLEKYNYCKGHQDSRLGESSGRSGVIADISSQKAAFHNGSGATHPTLLESGIWSFDFLVLDCSF